MAGSTFTVTVWICQGDMASTRTSVTTAHDGVVLATAPGQIRTVPSCRATPGVDPPARRSNNKGSQCVRKRRGAPGHGGRARARTKHGEEGGPARDGMAFALRRACVDLGQPRDLPDADRASTHGASVGPWSCSAAASESGGGRAPTSSAWTVRGGGRRCAVVPGPSGSLERWTVAVAVSRMAV